MHNDVGEHRNRVVPLSFVNASTRGFHNFDELLVLECKRLRVGFMEVVFTIDHNCAGRRNNAGFGKRLLQAHSQPMGDRSLTHLFREHLSDGKGAIEHGAVTAWVERANGAIEASSGNSPILY